MPKEDMEEQFTDMALSLDQLHDVLKERFRVSAKVCIQDDTFLLWGKHTSKGWGLYIYNNTQPLTPLKDSQVTMRIAGAMHIDDLIQALHEAHSVRVAELHKAIDVINNAIQRLEDPDEGDND